ncbi:LysR family transcriptional regulator [Paraburkholderia caballeronis]|uniref:LysR family transcriptional regulator n=1 Tax=Paraburkholderia caballeronis TaxID=416943 RepID=UPI001066EC89|nr:LysR family transcriptional regulator [Paraburkholderia caballeronis]TDV25551.1 LysR family transcriptional regulator [Paraburkholderia caballeronis]
MELRHLRSFAVLAETLHFGHAAERLRLAQPALTQQIQKLEHELGVRLFDRGPRSVKLTPVGVEFLVEARKAIEQVERAVLVAARAQRGEAGRLEISYVSSSAYSGVLPQLLGAFEREAPDVSVGLTEADLEFQMGYLQEGRVDAALIRLPVGTLPAGLAATTLRKEAVIVCVRDDHRLAKPVVQAAELAGEPFLATHLREGYGFYDTALRVCRAAGFEPTIVSRSHQFSTIVSLVAAGRGVALVPEPVGRLTLPGVAFARLDDCPFTSDIAIAHRASGNAPATERFLALCERFAAA